MSTTLHPRPAEAKTDGAPVSARDGVCFMETQFPVSKMSKAARYASIQRSGAAIGAVANWNQRVSSESGSSRHAATRPSFRSARRVCKRSTAIKLRVCAVAGERFSLRRNSTPKNPQGPHSIFHSPVEAVAQRKWAAPKISGGRPSFENSRTLPTTCLTLTRSAGSAAYQRSCASGSTSGTLARTAANAASSARAARLAR